ncbi:endonuclease/exonuclease/phosphatase family protein [Roseovarius aestuarii]|nr:endonuclease/exonuclease/phosphatase family protein [Roseovarius aestuarii]
MLRDILRGNDPQVAAAVQVIASARPDIVLLQNVDFDLDLLGLRALQAALTEAGLPFGTVFARRPNTGMPTGLDMDGDGRLGEPEDTHGYAVFSGQGGMAILSRYPLMPNGIQDFTPLLWRDVPGAMLPTFADGRPFPSEQAQNALRLATVAQWVVPLRHPSGPITLLAFHASPPVFDGPEDRNGRRNHDQLTFWRHYMDGVFGPAPDERFVVLGHANQDPIRGEGIKSGIRGLLSDPRLQDPKPARPGATSAPHATVEWPRVSPAIQRVSYVLPSRDWTVADAGVYWSMGKPEVLVASRHRLVWVDLVVD